jgi:signal transduction histidine kinase
MGQSLPPGAAGSRARSLTWPLAAPLLGLGCLLLPAHLRSHGLNAVILLTLLCTSTALLWRARRFPREATTWRWYAASYACFALSYAGYFVAEVVDISRIDRVTMGLIVTATLCQVLGLTRLPAPTPRPGTRLRSAMDAVTFALALLALQWLGGVAAGWATPGLALVDRVFIVMPYPALATTAGVIVYLANLHPERYLGVLGLLFVAEAVSTANNVAALSLAAVGAYTPGHPIDVLAPLSLAAVAAAALWPYAVDHRVERPRFLRLPSLLPYLPLAAVLALLVERHAEGRLAPAEDALWLVYPLLAVVIVRQVLTLGDLRRLSGTLEQRVEERTRELTAARAELARAHRLEALGRLAGGVAHDFDNLLTGIGGQAHLVARSRSSADAIAGYATEIQHAVERGAGLTRQILTFARRQPGAPRVLAPAVVVRNLERLLRGLLDEHTELVVRAPEGEGPAVRMDAGQLEQVVVNLVVNGRDALRGRPGRIVVAVDVAEVDPALAARHEVAPGRFATITVEDGGEGMSDDTRARLFQPFFSTKAPGKGTGLGLATSYGIVRGAGGFFTVRSAPGQGSTFVVHVPVTGERPDEALPAPAPPVTRAGRVLLLDGSPSLRATLAEALRAGGLEVTAAASLAEATALLAGRPGGFDVLVADTLVPQAPLHTVLTSSYHEVPEGELGARISLLGKPFLPDDLLRRIDHVLEGGR